MGDGHWWEWPLALAYFAGVVWALGFVSGVWGP